MNDGMACSSNFIIPRVQINGTLVPWNIFGYWFALVTWLGLMTETDTAIIITAYSGEPDSDIKNKMLISLCESFKDSEYPICLASHSPIPIEAQKYCDIAIYDSNNDFHVNGIPVSGRDENIDKNKKDFLYPAPISIPHGVAELTSIHNAINSLQIRFPNVKYFLKIAYDVSRKTPHYEMIKICKGKKNKLVGKSLPNSYSIDAIMTHMFFCEIEFFKNTLSLDELYRFDFKPGWLEAVWHSSIKEKGMLGEIDLEQSPGGEFLGFTILNKARYPFSFDELSTFEGKAGISLSKRI